GFGLALSGQADNAAHRDRRAAVGHFRRRRATHGAVRHHLLARQPECRRRRAREPHGLFCLRRPRDRARLRRAGIVHAERVRVGAFGGAALHADAVCRRAAVPRLVGSVLSAVGLCDHRRLGADQPAAVRRAVPLSAPLASTTPAPVTAIPNHDARSGHSSSTGMAISAAQAGTNATNAAAFDAPMRAIAMLKATNATTPDRSPWITACMATSRA